jgi:hypothetical protein
MTVLITCSKCGWIGSNCYMGIQFDKQNRCAVCQPKKILSFKAKKVDWSKEREDDSIE